MFEAILWREKALLLDQIIMMHQQQTWIS